MKEMNSILTRRTLLKQFCATTICAAVYSPAGMTSTRNLIKNTIPSSGEKIAVIGMGTSRTFDVGNDPAAHTELARVLRIFFDSGGQVIDSSPMYGTAESVLGKLFNKLGDTNGLFAATKVFTRGRDAGVRQMHESMQKMGVDIMDLMQVHNLVDWQVHLPTLRELKQQGKIRYIGITTSHGRNYNEFERIMKTELLDFVQFTYNIEDREAEKRLLPLARDKGIATMINVPFGRGSMFKKTAGKALPEWAGEFDCQSWAQFFLKYIISHPAVTCVIPATADPDHMSDNMQAGLGGLPDPATRAKMQSLYDAF